MVKKERQRKGVMNEEKMGVRNTKSLMIVRKDAPWKTGSLGGKKVAVFYQEDGIFWRKMTGRKREKLASDNLPKGGSNRSIAGDNRANIRKDASVERSSKLIGTNMAW